MALSKTKKRPSTKRKSASENAGKRPKAKRLPAPDVVWGSAVPIRIQARLPKSARLIIKKGWEYDATGESTVAVPCVHIFANAAGWAYFAGICAYMAKRRVTTPAWDDDPDDHVHFNSGSDHHQEFDTALSDRISFRFGTLTKKNLAAVCEKYDISATTAKRDCGVRRLRALADGAEQFMSGMMSNRKIAVSMTFGSSQDRI